MNEEMGSTNRGLITGYVCRLCSKMNRYVLLIYSKDGEKLDLVRKINSYLPITVDRNDHLPKTVCIECIERLESQHKMMEMIKRNALARGGAPVRCNASFSAR